MPGGSTSGWSGGCPVNTTQPNTPHTSGVDLAKAQVLESGHGPNAPSAALVRAGIDSGRHPRAASRFRQGVRVLPLTLQDGSIRVATATPGDARVIEDIRLLTGLEVQEFEAPAAEIVGERSPSATR